MKKILTIVLVSGVFNSADIFAQTGWFSQNSGTTNNLNCIYFLNDNQGFAVGDAGTILMTTDGGSNWSGSSGGSVDFYSIYFFDAASGLITCSNGTVIRTTNGGITWEPPVSLASDVLYTISFSGSNGIIGGGSQDIFYSADAGISWATAQSGFFGGGFYGSYMLSPSIGFVAGENSIFQPLFGVSTDGGSNWNFVSFYLNGNEGSLSGVYFFDQSNGVTSARVWDGTGAVSVTSDGGNNWSSTIFPSALNGIYFPSASVGYSVGDNGEILKSTDSGDSWANQTSNTNSNLSSVYFTSENTGYAVGDGGVILKTTTGGVIPVELTSFTASVEENEVVLHWSTVTETNNKGFEIERLNQKFEIRNSQWEKIGFIQGNGTTTEPKSYSFADNLNHAPAIGEAHQGRLTLFYRLKQVDYDGTYEYSDEVEVNINLPLEFSLSQNYPNPFNPTTKISWQSPVGSWQTLKVYDILGREVATLVNEYKPAGKYTVDFNASKLASGVYIYKLVADDFVSVKKMLLLK